MPQLIKKTIKLWCFLRVLFTEPRAEVLRYLEPPTLTTSRLVHIGRLLVGQEICYYGPVVFAIILLLSQSRGRRWEMWDSGKHHSESQRDGPGNNTHLLQERLLKQSAHYWMRTFVNADWSAVTSYLPISGKRCLTSFIPWMRTPKMHTYFTLWNHWSQSFSVLRGSEISQYFFSILRYCIGVNGGAENAGVENAGVENAGVDSRGGKCRSGKYRSDNVWKAVTQKIKILNIFN